ncbi:MAG TPA: tetratricopeptide repeat protein [Terriglobales bacterium]|nr:tetratricopeptide repeat protein [Terriglobales bacterium]
MNNLLRVSVLAAVAGMVVSATGCKQLEARDQLNRGVAAFKGAQFNQAIEHFQNAIQDDPTLVNAKLYLATAYQSQFIPGAPSADNMRMAQQAIDEYKVVLDQHPDNQNAVAGLARLEYDMGNLDDARKYYGESLTLAPKDPTAHYTLGAIDYSEIHPPIRLAKQAEGITDELLPLISKKSPPAAKKSCQTMAQTANAKIDDGITQLNAALDLRPDYADAMTYLNLLYRDKADLTCGDGPEYQKYIKIANDFVDRSLAARKAEVAKQNAHNAGGVQVSQ